MSHVLPDTDPAAWSDPLTSALRERDHDTVGMVDEALRTRNVRLAYQPVFSTGGSTRPVFYEGLLRIMDKTGRVIPARDFMGGVETRETGRILDCVALDLGLRSLSSNPTLRLSVNMSARSIGYPRWTRTLENALAEDESIGRRLILEITESSAMLIPDIVTAFMGSLQNRGISFALDDFGAGFTSFRYLRDFCFDILKIDGQFVRGIAADPDNQVLARALVSIAGHFGMLAVAESVETADDAQWLAAAGVDCLQGYHLAAPSLRPEWIDCWRDAWAAAP